MAISILENVPLKDLTTFKVGGPARFFCEVTSEEELCEAIDFAKKRALLFFILGGGSNILLSDTGFDGLVIKMSIKGIFFDNGGDGIPHVEVTVGAGESWDGFVSRCIFAGLYGIENLSGIPGTVGAAPVQNIGAYGMEVKDVIESVRVYDVTTDAFIELMNPECHFEYRDSLFKKQNRYIVTSVIFNLKKDGKPNIDYKDLREFFAGKSEKSVPDLSEVRKAVLAIRARKLPDVSHSVATAINVTDVIGTAGSFFKNPIIPTRHYEDLKKTYPDLPSYPVNSINNALVKIPLGWVLDHICGYKGLAKGKVGTYANQALVIINNGGATAKEVKSFAEEITAIVKEKTGIVIEPEVQYIG